MESDVNRPLKLNVVLACAAFLSLFSLSGTATACATLHEQDLNYLSNAQIVVRARMISYQPVFDPELQERRRKFREALSKNGGEQLVGKLSDRSANGIRITFEVVEMISGSPPLDNLEANWVHSTYAMPERWEGPENVIVGLRAAIDRHGMPFVQLVQQPCAPAMILEDTPDNRKAVTDAISAQRRKHMGYVFQ